MNAAAADDKKKGTIDPVADLPGAILKRIAADPLPPFSDVQRLLDQARAYRDEARELRKLADEVGPEVEKLRRELADARAELDAKTSVLRQCDPDDVRRSVEAARAGGKAEALATVEFEMTVLRGEVARLKSENEELRASKKKLREALERAKEGR
jgi:predicted  nucleic acid-binding Zn-ribbon protein